MKYLLFMVLGVFFSVESSLASVMCPHVAVALFEGAPPSLETAAADTRDLIADALACGGVTDPRRADVIIEFTADEGSGAVVRVTSGMRDGVLIHRISASPDDLADGLYAVLQEHLGFRFVHPRHTIVPTLNAWPLGPDFAMEMTPRFSSRGFHLHTMHPTEIALQLHDPTYPGAERDVAEYIDWLARNGQNTFGFYLQRGIDPVAWPAHAARYAAYARQRGVDIGVMVSVSKLQQHAFQLVKLLRPNYRRQAEQSVDWLMQVPWDFVVLDTPVGEYLPDLQGRIDPVIAAVESRIMGHYGTQVMYATHVIRDESRIWSNAKPRQELEMYRGACSGILVHTVMCYSLFEPTPGVYANENFQHMLAIAIEDVERRQTWFWPESAYWVAFDNSVPILLLPYLDTRLTDIIATERLGLHGHVTFSSGWEWGYWLIDWSIARWSWDHGVEPDAVDGIRMVAGEEMADVWSDALALQNEWLKGERHLLRHLPALDPMAELPPPLDFSFQPRPEYGQRELLHAPAKGPAVKRARSASNGLEQYAEASARLLTTMRTSGHPLMQELADAFEVTRLRALHKAAVMRALIAQRTRPYSRQPLTRSAERELFRAAAIRNEALHVVQRRESAYRYPVELIAGKREGITAYGFGYLYPVRGLKFWEREERQVKTRRFGALFETVWPMWDVFGLSGLVFGETYRPAD